MKFLVFCSSILFLLSACSGGMQKQLSVDTMKSEQQTAVASEDHKGYADLPLTEPEPVSKPRMKLPAGLYSFSYTYRKNIKMEHTVSFNKETYRLQERYISGGRDSVVITEGTWAPSDGYIWLYKDQVVNGRYLWRGDTLQYFDPSEQRRYSMQKLTAITGNGVLSKKAEQTKFYGLGTEPFWSIELDRLDTIRFSLPDWEKPLTMKVARTVQSNDSLIYSASADSLSLNVVVLPYFCSDGMSDFVYSSKVLVRFNGKTYTGCGIR